MRGSSTVYLRILNWSPRPPMSEKSTLPGSSLIMLNTMGSTSLGRTRMMVRVVWSRATRAPTTSLDRSILTLTPTTFLVPLDALMISVSRWRYIFQLWVLWGPRQSFVPRTEEFWVGFQFWWLLCVCLWVRIFLMLVGGYFSSSSIILCRVERIWPGTLGGVCLVLQSSFKK